MDRVLEALREVGKWEGRVEERVWRFEVLVGGGGGGGGW